MEERQQRRNGATGQRRGSSHRDDGNIRKGEERNRGKTVPVRQKAADSQFGNHSRKAAPARKTAGRRGPNWKFKVQGSMFQVVSQMFLGESSEGGPIPTCISPWEETVRCSLFVVQCSLFVVQCSLFGVYCSVFGVWCSLGGKAGMLRSGFDGSDFSELRSVTSRGL